MSIAQTIFLKAQALPEEKAKEVLDFIEFLESRQASEKVSKRSRQAGSAVGKITITKDDNEYLEDFKDYMF